MPFERCKQEILESLISIINHGHMEEVNNTIKGPKHMLYRVNDFESLKK